MIEVLSLWAKNLGVTIVIVSILEMLLPNNKTKKYIRMVLGIFLLFNIISPLIQNKEKFNLSEIDFSKYETTETTIIDQKSMDERIKELSETELEKDIVKKIEEKGYKVLKCKVTINNNENRDIKKIKIVFEKSNNKKNDELEKNENSENKIITEIEKIKKIDTKIKQDNNSDNLIESLEPTREDIKNVKKFLVEEYEVKEKCLEIN